MAQNVLIWVFSLVAVVVGYFLTEIIYLLLMGRAGGYELTLNPLIRQIRTALDTGRLNDDVIKEAIYNNIRLRVLVVFLVYIPLIGLLMALCAEFREEIMLARLLMMADIGIIVNGFVQIVVEHSYWPQIMQYEGKNEQLTEMRFKKLTSVSADEKDLKFVLRLEEDEGDAEDIANLGDVVVLLMPPTGDIIYDTIM